MKSRRTILFIVLIIAVSGIAVFLARIYLYQNLILPITQVVWYLIRLVSVIDQKVIWSILIAVVFFASLIILWRQRMEATESAYPEKEQPEDRLAYWQRQIMDADRDVTYRPALQQKLKNMEAAAFLQSERADSEKNVLPVVKMKLPARIRQAGIILLNHLQPKRPKLVDREFERSLDQILETLESRLEMENDK